MSVPLSVRCENCTESRHSEDSLKLQPYVGQTDNFEVQGVSLFILGKEKYRLSIMFTIKHRTKNILQFQ